MTFQGSATQNQKRIYKIISTIVILWWIFSLHVEAQEIGAYRTRSSGVFSSAAIWETFNGTTWVAATAKPGPSNDIYIENAHLVTLAAPEQAKSVFLNAETGAFQKLNLNGYQLAVYGSLQAFSGPAPGVPAGAWNSTDWIGNGGESKLVFKGESRVIIPANAWSGLSTNSNYTVEFAANPTAKLTIQEPFKASKFIIKSGTVIQEGIPGLNCASFSFNTNSTIPGAYGALIIQNGGRLESHCAQGILLRSVNGEVPAEMLDVQEGGALVFHANRPEVNAALVNFGGTITYAAEMGTQYFVKGTFEGASTPVTYHHLTFEGNAVKQMPDELHLTGNMLNHGPGSVRNGPTSMTIEGIHNQSITGLSLTVLDLEVNKGAGKVTFDNDLHIERDFRMMGGEMGFGGGTLDFGSAMSGRYVYAGGSWHQLGKVVYAGLPEILTAENASFPFADENEGGIRTLQLLGPITASGTDLTIEYVQRHGVDHDADFLDNDGTSVLYQLNSYFTVSAPLSTAAIEMRINADDLVVDDVADLRIVADHAPAEGIHLTGIEEDGQMWARRSVELGNISETRFTIGSHRVATVLPLTWLDYGVSILASDNEIYWKIAGMEGAGIFEVYRSAGNVENFRLIGSIPALSELNGEKVYRYVDENVQFGGYLYYQIRSVWDGGAEYSPVFSAHRHSARGVFQLYPNPYEHGDLFINLSLSEESNWEEMEVTNMQGITVLQHQGNRSELIAFAKQELRMLKPGIYVVHWRSGKEALVQKWIRK